MDDLKSIEIDKVIKNLRRDGIKEIHINKDSKFGKEIEEYLDYVMSGDKVAKITVDNLEKLPFRWAKIYGVAIKIWNE